MLSEPPASPHAGRFPGVFPALLEFLPVTSETPQFFLRPGEDHRLVRALLKDQIPGATPSVAVDRRDEMFRHSLLLTHGNRDQALVDYFRAGLTAARTFGQLLGWLGERRGRPLRILDFAAGWGRVTRFLAAAFPQQRLEVSDISTGAVEFQRRVLGIEGFPSAHRPGELDLAGREGYDALLVGSLFTHLPAGSFGAWLERLLGLLGPGGVLAFSTHPEDSLPAGAEMPSSGLYYETASEIPTLDVAEYGRTWVTDGYVEDALRRAGGGGLSHRPFRRCLWHLQDLWVVSREPGDALDGLEIDGGPDGRIDDGDWEEEPERLWIGGWAAHPQRPASPVEVEVRIEGRPPVRLRTEVERPDVARRLGGADPPPELATRGWWTPLEVRPERPDPSHLVLVKAVEGGGLEHVLHLSSFEGLQAWLEQKRLRAELATCRRELQKADRHLRNNAREMERLRSELGYSEASLFWKLRRGWWRLKRILGLGAEG